MGVEVERGASKDRTGEDQEDTGVQEDMEQVGAEVDKKDKRPPDEVAWEQFIKESTFDYSHDEIAKLMFCIGFLQGQNFELKAARRLRLRGGR